MPYSWAKKRKPGNNMRWIEICIESNKDITEKASMILLEAGANGTRIQNPKEIKSLIDEAGAKELADYGDFSQILDKYRVIAYFATGFNFENLKAALNESLEEFDFRWKEVDDDEWTGTWKKYYKAFNLTPNIRIIPSWEADGDIAADTIIMDPGMAFGTGTHESTSLCAGLIEEKINPGDVVLDIGAGTGILSIAATMLGAKAALAIDIDPAAVKTAGQNFELNQTKNAAAFLGELKDISKFIESDTFKAAFDTNKAAFGGKFDLIAANIVSDVIISLAGDMKKYLKEGGSLVCSGIITEREIDVTGALEAAGFKNLIMRRKNEWTAISADA